MQGPDWGHVRYEFCGWVGSYAVYVIGPRAGDEPGIGAVFIKEQGKLWRKVRYGIGETDEHGEHNEHGIGIDTTVPADVAAAVLLLADMFDPLGASAPDVRPA